MGGNLREQRLHEPFVEVVEVHLAVVVTCPLLGLKDQLRTAHPPRGRHGMNQNQTEPCSRRFLHPRAFFCEIPSAFGRMIHIDVTFIQIDLRPKDSASSISVRKLGSQIGPTLVLGCFQSSLPSRENRNQRADQRISPRDTTARVAERHVQRHADFVGDVIHANPDRQTTQETTIGTATKENTRARLYSSRCSGVVFARYSPASKQASPRKHNAMIQQHAAAKSRATSEVDDAAAVTEVDACIGVCVRE